MSEAGTLALLKEATLEYVLMTLASTNWTPDDVWQFFLWAIVINYLAKFGPLFSFLAAESLGLLEEYRIRPKDEELNSPELYQLLTHSVIQTFCMDVLYLLGLTGMITHVSAPLKTDHNWIVTFLRACLWVELGDINGYWLHRAQHALPWLYQFHKTHHQVRSVHVGAASHVHWFEELTMMGSYIVALAELVAIESLLNVTLSVDLRFQTPSVHFMLWGLIWIHVDASLDHSQFQIPGVWLCFLICRPWSAYDYFTVSEQTRAHEIHHRLNAGNFGFNMRHDKWWGTYIRPNMNKKELEEEMMAKQNRDEVRKTRKSTNPVFST